MKRYYLSGPMSGIEDNNFPAFNAAEARLRELGHDAINPAKFDDAGMTREEMLARDVEIVLTVPDLDGLVMINGWHMSDGSNLEAIAARCRGLDMFLEPDGSPDLEPIKTGGIAWTQAHE